MIWTILGISVAILAVFCVSVAELFVGKPLFEQNRLYIAGTLAAAGVVAWCIGRVLARGCADAQNEEGSRFLLFDGRYWGPMLLALSCVTLFIRPLKDMKNNAVRGPERTNTPAAPKQQIVAAPVKRTPATFPKLKVQGVIFRRDHPVVIINGHSYTAGDRLGDVLVKSIDRSGVTLELEGELRLLSWN